MISYCTNVHAGTTLAQCMANLQTHAVAVKAQVSPKHPLGVGLWLAADAAKEAAAGDGAKKLGDFLTMRGLVACTFNGFPFGNFHADKVKHAVYLPTWADESRLRYTLDLAKILAQLLPEGQGGSISTLPLGWPPAAETACGKNLRLLAEELDRLHQHSGRLIRVALEPEPGCAFDTAPGAARFFEAQLNDPLSRQYLGICHDVCHSAVMFEPQTHALQAYREAGIALVKIQLSNAMEADFSTRCPEARGEMRAQLNAFAEDRYLHQTVVQSASGQTHFFEDLPQALAAAGRPEIGTGCWRVHFHVPLFLENFGLLDTTQAEIAQCLNALAPGENPHLEVETYAWGVLPAGLKPANLADGIAKEILFARQRAGVSDILSLTGQRPDPSPKRIQHAFLRPDEAAEKRRANLPHWRQDAVSYFVTYRLADSLPAEKLLLWQRERRDWESKHPQPWSPEEHEEYDTLFTERMDAWLDAGHGSCILKNPALREIVANAMHHFDGERYALGAWVIMPNHVHTVVTPHPGQDISNILQSWNSFTAKEINKQLGKTGTVWQKEPWERILRNSKHLFHVQNYIRRNPKNLPSNTYSLNTP